MADVLILAIETATGCGSVALTRGTGHTGKVLAEYSLQPARVHGWFFCDPEQEPEVFSDTLFQVVPKHFLSCRVQK